MGHYVYKYVYDGEIVYIGKNDTNLETRINQHKLEEKFKPYLKADIYYIELANSIMSDVVESELIRRYKPKLNVAKMSDWSGLEFAEPEWKLFKPMRKKTVNLSRKNKTTSNRPSRKDIRIKTCELMSKYYCAWILENISKVVESEEYYEIKIPISKDDPEHEYCVPPYIKVKKSGKSLGYCCGDDRYVTYTFRKCDIFSNFYNVELGLINRIKYMKDMYENELRELSFCQ